MKKLILLFSLLMVATLSQAQHLNEHLPVVSAIHCYQVSPGVAQLEMRISGQNASQITNSGLLTITGDVVQGGSTGMIATHASENYLGGGNETVTLVGTFAITALSQNGPPSTVTITSNSSAFKMRLGQLDGAAITSVGLGKTTGGVW